MCTGSLRSQRRMRPAEGLWPPAHRVWICGIWRAKMIRSATYCLACPAACIFMPGDDVAFCLFYRPLHCWVWRLATWMAGPCNPALERFPTSCTEPRPASPTFCLQHPCPIPITYPTPHTQHLQISRQVQYHPQLHTDVVSQVRSSCSLVHYLATIVLASKAKDSL